MIFVECTSANPSKSQKPVTVKNFTSYTFDRSVLTPASAFRFTAPGVNVSDRLSIRSGDMIRFYADNYLGHRAVVGTGFIDETETHITPRSIDYSLVGRDTVSQLVDNDSVDAKNNLIFFQQANIQTLVGELLKNTRLTQSHKTSGQMDASRTLAVSTNLGETKLSTLQRYLEFVNGLVWADNTGELIVDKPNFTQQATGNLTLKFSDPSRNNLLEARVRRNLNQIIRQIVTQLNGTEAARGTYETLHNMDRTFKAYRGTLVGRSISRSFGYASGTDIINQQATGNGSLNAHTLGREYSAREIARENMKIIDVEAVVEGHFNKAGYLYNVDQIYQVDIEDEGVSEPMYVYGVSYELTIDHGMLTRLHLCRLWSICAYANQLQQVVST